MEGSEESRGDSVAVSTQDAVSERSHAASAVEAVLRWNALSTSLAPALVPPGFLLPWTESRYGAITNVAVHDALNGVRQRYARYADQGDTYRNANATAAAISAGFNSIAGVIPAAALAPATAAYDADIAALRAQRASGIYDGIAVGKRAAEAVLARRVGDGVDHPDGPYVPGSDPGDCRFIAPFNGPPFDLFGTGGVFFGNLIGNARPFVIRSSTQFDAWETARLLALVQLAAFDSYVASLESKNHCSVWRPVTAVELAATYGNPATATKAGWQALGAPTPPTPDYPSGHSSAGGAAAAVIDLLVPRKHQSLDLTSTTLTGVTRHFNNAWTAARENANSRVLV